MYVSHLPADGMLSGRRRQVYATNQCGRRIATEDFRPTGEVLARICAERDLRIKVNVFRDAQICAYENCCISALPTQSSLLAKSYV